jgi:hypothetical protein
LDVLAIDFGALGLAIGAVGAAEVGAFVPGEAEPAEGVEDLLLGGGDEAGAVGVLDAEDELAPALPRVEEVDEANVGGANVGVAGGRGGDADADVLFSLRGHGCQLLMLAAFAGGARSGPFGQGLSGGVGWGVSGVVADEQNVMENQEMQAVAGRYAEEVGTATTFWEAASLLGRRRDICERRWKRSVES